MDEKLNEEIEKFCEVILDQYTPLSDYEIVINFKSLISGRRNYKDFTREGLFKNDIYVYFK